jgi:rubrerythrin
MTVAGRSASDVLRDAIAMEVDGKEFFERASGMVARKRSKEMFLSLAAQEGRHIEVLSHELGRLEAGRGWSTLDEARASTGGEGHSVFSHGDVKRLRLAPVAGELEVIDVGIGIEQRSIDYYRAAGQASEDPKARQVFNWLVGEETGHLTILRAERDSREGSGFHYGNMEFSLETE